MIEELIDAICRKLSDVYDIPVYTESVKQGLQEPCFFVRTLSLSNNQFLGDRYFRTSPFVIHYFPGSENEPKLECYKIADQLYPLLEYIVAGDDLIRGTDLHHELSDDVLLFFVKYDFFTVSKDKKATMQNLKKGIDIDG